jgi:hypothetical protein
MIALNVEQDLKWADGAMKGNHDAHIINTYAASFAYFYRLISLLSEYKGIW